MKFSGVCLNTKSVIELARFYEQVLGVQAEGDATHMQLNPDGVGIAIFSLEGMESLAPRSTSGMGFGSVTLMFEVHGVDVEYQRLRALGVMIVKAPQTYPWGARSFWFKDPDGNIVDFYEQVVKA